MLFVRPIHLAVCSSAVALYVAACGGSDDSDDSFALTCPPGQSLDPSGAECVDDVVCEAGQFGADCEPCDCLYGSCQDGVEGDGSCGCEQGWLGTRCDEPDPLDPPAKMRLAVEKKVDTARKQAGD